MLEGERLLTCMAYNILKMHKSKCCEIIFNGSIVLKYIGRHMFWEYYADGKLQSSEARL